MIVKAQEVADSHTLTDVRPAVQRAIWQSVFYIKILQNIHALFLENSSTFNNFVKELIIDVNKDLYQNAYCSVIFK